MSVEWAATFAPSVEVKLKMSYPWRVTVETIIDLDEYFLWYPP